MEGVGVTSGYAEAKSYLKLKMARFDPNLSDSASGVTFSVFFQVKLNVFP